MSNHAPQPTPDRPSPLPATPSSSISFRRPEPPSSQHHHHHTPHARTVTPFPPTPTPLSTTSASTIFTSPRSPLQPPAYPRSHYYRPRRSAITSPARSNYTSPSISPTRTARQSRISVLLATDPLLNKLSPAKIRELSNDDELGFTPAERDWSLRAAEGILKVGGWLREVEGWGKRWAPAARERGEGGEGAGGGGTGFLPPDPGTKKKKKRRNGEEQGMITISEEDEDEDEDGSWRRRRRRRCRPDLNEPAGPGFSLENTPRAARLSGKPLTPMQLKMQRRVMAENGEATPTMQKIISSPASMISYNSLSVTPTHHPRRAHFEGHSSNESDSEDGFSDTDDDEEYYGSLPKFTVEAYEIRIEEIKEAVEELDVEGLKGKVLSYRTGIDNPLTSSSAIITATTLQLLPPLHRLMKLLSIWAIRLTVLKIVPVFLRWLDNAKSALKAGYDAINLPAIVNGTQKLDEEIFAVMSENIQARVAAAGRIMDSMLDALEGREDVLPDSWIGELEDVEEGVSSWEMDAERIVLEGRLREVSKAEEFRTERKKTQLVMESERLAEEAREDEDAVEDVLEKGGEVERGLMEALESQEDIQDRIEIEGQSVDGAGDGEEEEEEVGGLGLDTGLLRRLREVKPSEVEADRGRRWTRAGSVDNGDGMPSLSLSLFAVDPVLSPVGSPTFEAARRRSMAEARAVEEQKNLFEAALEQRDDGSGRRKREEDSPVIVVGGFESPPPASPTALVGRSIPDSNEEEVVVVRPSTAALFAPLVEEREPPIVEVAETCRSFGEGSEGEGVITPPLGDGEKEVGGRREEVELPRTPESFEKGGDGDKDHITAGPASGTADEETRHLPDIVSGNTTPGGDIGIVLESEGGDALHHVPRLGEIEIQGSVEQHQPPEIAAVEDEDASADNEEVKLPFATADTKDLIPVGGARKPAPVDEGVSTEKEVGLPLVAADGRGFVPGNKAHEFTPVENEDECASAGKEEVNLLLITADAKNFVPDNEAHAPTPVENEDQGGSTDTEGANLPFTAPEAKNPASGGGVHAITPIEDESASTYNEGPSTAVDSKNPAFGNVVHVALPVEGEGASTGNEKVNLPSTAAEANNPAFGDEVHAAVPVEDEGASADKEEVNLPLTTADAKDLAPSNEAHALSPVDEGSLTDEGEVNLPPTTADAKNLAPGNEAHAPAPVDEAGSTEKEGVNLPLTAADAEDLVFDNEAYAPASVDEDVSTDKEEVNLPPTTTDAKDLIPGYEAHAPAPVDEAGSTDKEEDNLPLTAADAKVLIFDNEAYAPAPVDEGVSTDKEEANLPPTTADAKDLVPGNEAHAPAPVENEDGDDSTDKEEVNLPPTIVQDLAPSNEIHVAAAELEEFPLACVVHQVEKPEEIMQDSDVAEEAESEQHVESTPIASIATEPASAEKLRDTAHEVGEVAASSTISGNEDAVAESGVTVDGGEKAGGWSPEVVGMVARLNTSGPGGQQDPLDEPVVESQSGMEMLVDAGVVAAESPGEERPDGGRFFETKGLAVEVGEDKIREGLEGGVILPGSGEVNESGGNEKEGIAEVEEQVSPAPAGIEREASPVEQFDDQVITEVSGDEASWSERVEKDSMAEAEDQVSPAPAGTEREASPVEQLDGQDSRPTEIVAEAFGDVDGAKKAVEEDEVKIPAEIKGTGIRVDAPMGEKEREPQHGEEGDRTTNNEVDVEVPVTAKNGVDEHRVEVIPVDRTLSQQPDTPAEKPSLKEVVRLHKGAEGAMVLPEMSDKNGSPEVSLDTPPAARSDALDKPASYQMDVEGETEASLLPHESPENVTERSRTCSPSPSYDIRPSSVLRKVSMELHHIIGYDQESAMEKDKRQAGSPALAQLVGASVDYGNEVGGKDGMPDVSPVLRSRQLSFDRSLDNDIVDAQAFDKQDISEVAGERPATLNHHRSSPPANTVEGFPHSTQSLAYHNPATPLHATSYNTLDDDSDGEIKPLASSTPSPYSRSISVSRELPSIIEVPTPHKGWGSPFRSSPMLPDNMAEGRNAPRVETSTRVTAKKKTYFDFSRRSGSLFSYDYDEDSSPDFTPTKELPALENYHVPSRTTGDKSHSRSPTARNYGVLDSSPAGGSDSSPDIRRFEREDTPDMDVPAQPAIRVVKRGAKKFPSQIGTATSDKRQRQHTEKPWREGSSLIPPETPTIPPPADLDREMDQRINSILNSLPQKIKLTATNLQKLNEQSKKLTPIRPWDVSGSHIPAPKSVASERSVGSSTPGYAKNTRRHLSSVQGDIKCYHLHRNDEHPPMKLYVRLVGNKRLVCRVGGGWSDLEEYLREWATHHGSKMRAVSESRLEIREIPAHNGPTGQRTVRPSGSNSSLKKFRSPTPSGSHRSPSPGPVSRPASSAGTRPGSAAGTRPGSSGTVFSITTRSRHSLPPRPTSAAFVRAESPSLSPSPVIRGGGGVSNRPSTATSSTSFNVQLTPPSAYRNSPPSRPSSSGRGGGASRLSFTETVDTPLGLAGPRSSGKGVTAENMAWVGEVIGQVRRVSTERGPSAVSPGSRPGSSSGRVSLVDGGGRTESLGRGSGGKVSLGEEEASGGDVMRRVYFKRGGGRIG